ncbi:MAG: hypothetical protein ABI199_11520 [Bacteroidia bacterium]
MKPFFVLLLCSCFLFFGFQTDSGDSCNIRALKIKCKPMLSPYTYDSSQIMHIRYFREEKRREFEVPLFVDQKYRIVFTSTSLQQPINVEVYKKDFTHEKRELLFSSTSDKGNIFSFEPARGTKIFVDYIIPASKDSSNTTEGCVAFLLGYQ